MNNYFTKTLFLLLIPILFFFSAGLNQTAHACSCAEGTIRDDFEREHTVIFSGKVTNIKEQQRSYLVSFEINQAWKDLPNDVKSINTSTPQSSSLCGYGFTEDESYLVVASGPWDQTPNVSSCSSTIPLEYAQKEISFLSKTVSNLAGTLQEKSPILVNSPKIQVFNGVAPDDVICKSDQQLIFKFYNGNPTCVKPETAKRLLDVKWATKYPFEEADPEKHDRRAGWLYSYCDKVGGMLFQPFLDERGPLCNLPTSDAGTECIDSSQCESHCQAKEGAEAGSQESGLCYGYQHASCWQVVIDGKVQQMECT